MELWRAYDTNKPALAAWKWSLNRLGAIVNLCMSSYFIMLAQRTQHALMTHGLRVELWTRPILGVAYHWELICVYKGPVVSYAFYC